MLWRPEIALAVEQIAGVRACRVTGIDEGEHAGGADHVVAQRAHVPVGHGMGAVNWLSGEVGDLGQLLLGEFEAAGGVHRHLLVRVTGV